MKGTFPLPGGGKIRTGSQRRYIVVGRFRDKPTVFYRTDELSRARGRACIYGRDNVFVVDTHNGEIREP